MDILARQNAVGQECPTYILRLDKALHPQCAAQRSPIASLKDKLKLARSWAKNLLGKTTLLTFAEQLSRVREAERNAPFGESVKNWCVLLALHTPYMNH